MSNFIVYPDGSVVNLDVAARGQIPSHQPVQPAPAITNGMTGLPSDRRIHFPAPGENLDFAGQNMASSGGLAHPGGPCSALEPPLSNKNSRNEDNLTNFRGQSDQRQGNFQPQTYTGQINQSLPPYQGQMQQSVTDPRVLQQNLTINNQVLQSLTNSRPNSLPNHADRGPLNRSNEIMPQANFPVPLQQNGLPGRPQVNDPTLVSNLSENALDFYNFLDRTRVQRASDMSILQAIPEDANLPGSRNLTNHELLLNSNINFGNNQNETSVFGTNSADNINRMRQNLESTRINEGTRTPTNDTHAVNMINGVPLQSTGLGEPGRTNPELLNLAAPRRAPRRAMTPQLQANLTQAIRAGQMRSQQGANNQATSHLQTQQMTPQVRFQQTNLLPLRQRQPSPGLGNQPIVYSLPGAAPAGQNLNLSRPTPESLIPPRIPQAAPRNSTALNVLPQHGLTPVQAQRAPSGRPQDPIFSAHQSQGPNQRDAQNSRPNMSVTPIQGHLAQPANLQEPARAAPAARTEDPGYTNAITELGRMTLMMHNQNLEAQNNVMTFLANQTQNNAGGQPNNSNNNNTNNNNTLSNSARPKILAELNKVKPPKWSYHESESLIRVLQDFDLYISHHNLNQAEVQYALQNVFRVKGAAGQEEALQVIEEAGQDLTTKSGRVATYKSLVRYYQPDHVFTFRRKRGIDTFFNVWIHLRTLLSFDDSEGEVDSNSPVLKRRAWKKMVEPGNEILSHAEKQFLRARGLEADVNSKVENEVLMRNFLNISHSIWKIQNSEQPTHDDYKGRRHNKGKAVNAVKTETPPRARSPARTFVAESPVKPAAKPAASGKSATKAPQDAVVAAVGEPFKCFECDSPSHLYASCPVRLAKSKSYKPTSGYVPKAPVRTASAPRCGIKNCPDPEGHPQSECPHKCEHCLKMPRVDPGKIYHVTADHKTREDWLKAKQEREARQAQRSNSGQGYRHVKMEIFHGEDFINLVQRKIETVSAAEGTGGRYLYLTSVLPDGRAMDGVIDTGCTCDGVLDEHVAVKAGIRGEILDQNIKVKLANGSQTSTAKTMSTHLTIGGKRLSVNLLLMPVSVPTGLLIGKPVLERLGLLRTLEDAAADMDKVTQRAGFTQVAKTTSRPQSKNRQ